MVLILLWCMHSRENMFPSLFLIIYYATCVGAYKTARVFYQRILLFFVYYQIVSYPSFTVEITKKTVSSRHLFGGIIMFKVSA